MDIDYRYLAGSVSSLSGIPVRVYKDGYELCRSFPTFLPADPMELYKSAIFAIKDHVGYYCTPYFHYYGVLNAGGVRIVIGPTSQIMADEQKLRELAFKADVLPEDTSAFIEGMNGIMRMPAETLLQMLCALNHFLNNGEKLEISDIAIDISQQDELKTNVERSRTGKVYGEDGAATQAHNTIGIEEALVNIVRNGDSVALKRWISSIPAIRSGTIAADQLRQMKNLFIVTATLVSRAAVRGGMRGDDALSLSDAYIRRAELLNSGDGIRNLQYNMILEFTEQVGNLRRGGHSSKLTLDVANYVRHHLSEPVSVSDMAREFFFSRPYLSEKFKKETGQTLTDFILKEKTEEAKRLLRYSDKPLSSVGAYLGFSSQGHFARVFKKYAGVTPGEYQKKHRS